MHSLIPQMPVPSLLLPHIAPFVLSHLMQQYLLSLTSLVAAAPLQGYMTKDLAALVHGPDVRARQYLFTDPFIDKVCVCVYICVCVCLCVHMSVCACEHARAARVVAVVGVGNIFLGSFEEVGVFLKRVRVVPLFFACASSPVPCRSSNRCRPYFASSCRSVTPSLHGGWGDQRQGSQGGSPTMHPGTLPFSCRLLVQCHTF